TTRCVPCLRASQLNILTVTGKLGLARPARVCEILQLDTSTLSRNVERMRAQGWLSADLRKALAAAPPGPRKGRSDVPPICFGQWSPAPQVAEVEAFHW